MLVSLVTKVRATEDLAVQSAVLRKELEATLLKDLDQLDERALRYRIIQLAAEMQERTKWEVREGQRNTPLDVVMLVVDWKADRLDLVRRSVCTNL